MVVKQQKLLLGDNAPGKCLHGHMQHFFRPSPAIEKKFAESAFFHTKIKYLSWNRWIYEQMGGKHQEQLLSKNSLRRCLQAHMQHFFRPSPAIEKKFAESAFFHTKIKTCQETVEFTSKWGKSTKNYSWATMPIASAFRPTCKISSALAPLSRKNTLNQRIEHYFIQKSKTCHETVEFTSKWWKNTKKFSCTTMPVASAFWPTCNISSALAPLSRKNTLNQRIEHFFIQKPKTCHETAEYTSQWWQNTKN